MTRPVQILLQTTIPQVEDDWSIERFSMLHDFLASLKDEQGTPLYTVTARNRETNAQGDDVVLSVLDTTNFDELWLFAVDTGKGLTTTDCEGITRFHQRGGGILATRDHEDLGSSLCTLGVVGRAHFFHSKNQDPDESRHVRDDQESKTISWPNYHSGANGNYQNITAVQPVHELLKNPDNASGAIEYFPAHPHEGSVGVPDGEEYARIVAEGVSQTTDRRFNLVVAFEGEPVSEDRRAGRSVADSSFHHFVDYNWNTSKGCPTFLYEPPGDEIKRDPAKLGDVKVYVSNLAKWLAPSRTHN